MGITDAVSTQVKLRFSMDLSRTRVSSWSGWTYEPNRGFDQVNHEPRWDFKPDLSRTKVSFWSGLTHNPSWDFILGRSHTKVTFQHRLSLRTEPVA